MHVQLGGAEIFVKDLLKALKNANSKNNYELWVLHDASELMNNNKDAIKFENNYIEELTKNNIEVKRFHKKSGIIERFRLYSKIYKEYKKSKPDIIHCHLETVTFNICLALLFTKANIIETIHNTKIFHKKMLKYFISKKVRKFITIAEIVTSVMIKDVNISQTKIVQIYNGIDVSNFKCKREFDLDKKNINIVAIGRLEKQKNYLMLLNVFNKVNKRCLNDGKYIIQLHIYGQGSLKVELEKYMKDNQILNVELKGITTDVQTILKSSDIYMMTSIYEGFSISLIEALASGISIICTNVGGNNEIIQDNSGILVDSNDEKECANKLYEVINNKELRQKLYDNAIKNATKFDIKFCADEHIRIYNELL